MHKKKAKIKKFFNLTIQYLEKYSWQPTPVFLSGKSMDRGAWWATVHRIIKECQTRLSN